MDVWEAIQQKRAVRQYTGESLSEDAIDRILNAGRRSQSSKNTQPWHFIVVRDRATLEKLAQTGKYLDHLRQAALAVVIATPDRAAEDSNWIAFDIGQCAAYMQLAAEDLGVGSVVGRMHQADEAGSILGLPAELRADVIIAFGYPAPEIKNRPLKKGGRRPLEDIVHWEKW